MELTDQHAFTQAELEVPMLGARSVPSPLARALAYGTGAFVPDESRVLVSVDPGSGGAALSFEKAGPRYALHFDPARTRVGIVTCGGLCPGTNSVVRSLVLQLHHGYHVKDVLGFRFGYEGLSRRYGVAPTLLTPASVTHIHRAGGSVLGSGRGAQDPAEMVARLRELEVNVLIAIGGDGTLRGAHALALEAARAGTPLSVVGVPKTIDNDIPFVDQTFGFDTAVQVAAQALTAAHTEATSARNGIAVVKLMGRDAGFICAHATLASHDVNFCLIPEVPFALEGPGGLLEALEARVRERGHALVAIAEGCGLALPRAEAERDPSGNLRLSSKALDIGPPLCERIIRHFADRQLSSTLKYIDPSYLIRSVPANASDNRYCDLLAGHAAHAALAGKTDLVIGHWNGHFSHVPLALVASRHKRVDPRDELWSAVLASTGQRTLGAGL